MFFITLFGALFSFSVIASITYFGIQSKNRALRANLDAANAELLSANKAMEGALVRLMLLEGQGKTNQSGSTEKKAAPKQKAAPAKKVQPEPKVIVAQKTQSEPKTERKDKSQVDNKKKARLRPNQKHHRYLPRYRPPNHLPSAIWKRCPISPKVTHQRKNRDDLPAMRVVSVTGHHDMDSVETVSEEALEVDKLEIWNQSGEHSVRFQFSLKNVSATGDKIKGYTFVVLKPGEGSSEPSRGSPWTPLEDGQPTIFKRGQFFSIARFKYVRGKIPQIQDVERFKTATIFVYTESGNLLIEKVFDVADILRS